MPVLPEVKRRTKGLSHSGDHAKSASGIGGIGSPGTYRRLRVRPGQCRFSSWPSSTTTTDRRKNPTWQAVRRCRLKEVAVLAPAAPGRQPRHQKTNRVCTGYRSWRCQQSARQGDGCGVDLAPGPVVCTADNGRLVQEGRRRRQGRRHQVWPGWQCLAQGRLPHTFHVSRSCCTKPGNSWSGKKYGRSRCSPTKSISPPPRPKHSSSRPTVLRRETAAWRRQNIRTRQRQPPGIPAEGGSSLDYRGERCAR